MTSQIVLMNKVGLAVASDSSLTMVIGDNRRTYASAEKIFPIGSEHKVAILHSGRTEFMDHPFEVLIAAWKKSLQRPYSTLDDYVESFCDWLTHRQDLFPETSQAAFLESLITEYLLEVRLTILKELNQAEIKKDDWMKPDVLERVNALLDSEIEYLDGQDELKDLNEKWAENRYQSLVSEIHAAIEYVFDDVPRDVISDMKYEAITKRILHKRIYSLEFDARLVFVGYGEKSLFPRHISVDFQGVVGDRVRHVLEAVSIEPNDVNSSKVRTHAQDEAIQTFLRAYHPYFSTIARNYQDESFQLMKEIVSEHLDESSRDSVFEQIEKLQEERRSGVTDEFRNTSDTDFVDPFISTVSGLPSTSLGKMAENLIELQILRQSSQAIQDTVGGPVDVAVITLEKGFQWFRHKTLDDLWGRI